MPLQHRHGYAAGIHHGLPTGDIDRSKSCPHDTNTERARVALQPRSVRFELPGHLRGFQPLVPHVRLSVLLAGPVPSDSADTSRRCHRCSHPPRRFPDQAAVSFNQPAATGRRRCPFTTARFNGASWRTTSMTHSRSGPTGSNARLTRSSVVSPSPGRVQPPRRR